MRQFDIGLGDVTVDKAELLVKVQANRAAHRAVFEKALVKFQALAVLKLNDLVSELRHGTLPASLHIGLPIPEEHTSDYDRAIGMIEMHIPKTVTLTEEAYMRLVQDDWGWKTSFANNTSSYLAQ